MSRGSRSRGWLLLQLTLLACDPPPVDRAVEVRDSAGVTIVENGPVDGLEAPWRLTRRPLMRIGWADDEPFFDDLYLGRVGSGDWVVVGDQNSRKVWKISLTGEVIAEWGGMGDGPGEFRGVAGVLVDGDSVFITDTRSGRVSVFDADGFVRDFRIPTNQRALSGVTPAGDFLRPEFAHRGFVYNPDRQWVYGSLLRTDRMGVVLDTVASYPSYKARPRRGIYDPFSPYGWILPSGPEVLTARSDVAEVRWFNLSGDLTRIARWGPKWVPVTEDAWEAYAESLAGLNSPEVDPSTVGSRIRELREWATEERLPLFTRVFVDPLSNVWLGGHVVGYDEPERFFLIGPDGRWLGSIEVPTGLRVFDIGSDVILGIEKDDWDVQAVAVYGIVKP